MNAIVPMTTNEVSINEFRAIWPIIIPCTHHTHCCRTNFFQTALRNTFDGYHVNTQLSGRTRARKWTAFRPRWPYKPTTAPRRHHWAAAPILIVQRSRSQLFSLRRFGGATALTEKNRDDSFELRMETSDSLVSMRSSKESLVSMRSSKESSRFFSVRAVAPPNLPCRHSEGASARKGGTLAAP